MIYNSGDKEQPCLTPLPIWHASEIQSLTRTYADWPMYRFPDSTSFGLSSWLPCYLKYLTTSPNLSGRMRFHNQHNKHKPCYCTWNFSRITPAFVHLFSSWQLDFNCDSWASSSHYMMEYIREGFCCCCYSVLLWLTGCINLVLFVTSVWLDRTAVCYFAPGIAISVSVCLSFSVCLSVCPMAYIKNYTSKLQEFSARATRGCVFVLLWWQWNKLCLWMTSSFPIVTIFRVVLE